jgi:glutathione S-transferase
MKLYIATATCSLAAQMVANELGLSPELVHYDVIGRSTSNGDNFAAANPLGYVPVLVLDIDQNDLLTETIVLTSYLADQHPEAGLIPAHAQSSAPSSTTSQLLVFLATYTKRLMT